jgi:hypothetical protein
MTVYNAREHIKKDFQDAQENSSGSETSSHCLGRARRRQLSGGAVPFFVLGFNEPAINRDHGLYEVYDRWSSYH